MITDVDPGGPDSFETMRMVAKELVGLLELNLKMMASARKMLSV